jgi:ribosome-associated protein YbcJ (S4-like RNA binding protein)
MAKIEIKDNKIYIDGKRSTTKEAESNIKGSNKINGSIINFGNMK